MSDQPLIDARPDHLEIIRAIMRRHVPKRKVWAFGSRVTWTAKPYSDLDLVILGDEPLDLGVLASLKEEFSESDLPWKVDVVDWASTSDSFRKIIKKNKVEFLLGEKVTEEWPRRSLSDLYEVRSGLSKKADQFGQGDPFLSFKDVFYNFFVPTELNQLVLTNETEKEAFSVHRGDVFLTRTSETVDELGMSCVALQDVAQATFNGFTKRLRPKKGVNLVPEYVGYYLRSPAFRQEILTFSNLMSTRASLNNEMIGRLKIKVPTLDIQREIGNVLKLLDDKIDLNRHMNETLEAMARAIFKDWFVDFGPTRAKMEGREPYLAQEIWDLFPDKLNDEGKPEGWEVSEIGKETTVVGGSTPSTKEPLFWGGGINWATPKDLSALKSPVLLETNRTVTAAGLEKISSGLLPTGTVLLSSRAPIGYIAISAIPVAVNQGFIALRCDGRLSNIYVWRWLHENMEAINGNANGSTFQEISKKNFRPLPVVVPSKEVILEFNNISMPLYERIAKNSFESQTLAQTRDLLLPKLMSGEIQVHEAEESVEGST